MSRIIWLAAILTTLLYFDASSLPAQTKSQAEALYKEAIRLFKSVEQDQGLFTSPKTDEVMGKVFEKLKQSLEISEKINCRRCVYNAAYALGECLRAKDPTEAVTFLEKALDVSRELKDRKEEAETLRNLGVANIYRGKTDEAAEFFEKALEINRELKDRKAEAQNLGNLGIAYGGPQTPKAIECLEKELIIRRELKDKSGEGRALYSLGNVCSVTSQNEKAMDYFEKALIIQKQLKDKKAETDVMERLAHVYSVLGKDDKAKEMRDILAKSDPSRKQPKR